MVREWAQGRARFRMLGHLRAVCCGERGRSTCRGRLPPLRTPAVVPVADDSDDDVPLSVLAALGPPDGRRCSIVHYCAVVWSIAQYCAILHTTAQYCAVLHSNAQYCAVVYCAVLCSAVQYGRCCTARRLLSLLSLLGSSFNLLEGGLNTRNDSRVGFVVAVVQFTVHGCWIHPLPSPKTRGGL